MAIRFTTIVHHIIHQSVSSCAPRRTTTALRLFTIVWPTIRVSIAQQLLCAVRHTSSYICRPIDALSVDQSREDREKDAFGSFVCYLLIFGMCMFNPHRVVFVTWITDICGRCAALCNTFYSGFRLRADDNRFSGLFFLLLGFPQLYIIQLCVFVRVETPTDFKAKHTM